MNKVIQVLAEMASDASLQNEKAIETLLTTGEINTEQSEAIITKDVTSLERQLDICPDIVCTIFPAEDDTPEEEEEEEEDNTDNEIKSIVNI